MAHCNLWTVVVTVVEVDSEGWSPDVLGWDEAVAADEKYEIFEVMVNQWQLMNNNEGMENM